MHDDTARFLSTLHTTAYRLTKGRVGRRLVKNNMLLLTTRGKSTGQRHTVPLLYLRDGPDLVVIASWGGRPYHPHWYLNLQAHPQASVQVSGDRWAVTGETLVGDEREKWWPRVVEAYGGYETYQSRSKRTIPVVRLKRA